MVFHGALSNTQVAKAIKEVDKDENGRLNKEEFRDFCSKFNAYGPARFFRRVGGSCTAVWWMCCTGFYVIIYT